MAGLLVVVVALSVTLLLTAFGSAETSRLGAAPGVAAPPLAQEPPRPEWVATVGASVPLQLPVSQSQLTGIGYHPSDGRALALRPIGRQANQGLFARLGRRLFGDGAGGRPYVQLGGGGSGGPSTGAVDIGAPAGTDVYSPVDGTVSGIRDYVVNGRTLGVRIEILTATSPSLVVVLTRLRPDPALTVGSTLVARTSKVGTLIDFSTVERQSLARFTHDAGNHVTLEVHPS
ncbi:MAG: hypothetical protein ABR521_09070 [Gaiellaceae bacterium]